MLLHRSRTCIFCSFSRCYILSLLVFPWADRHEHVNYGGAQNKHLEGNRGLLGSGSASFTETAVSEQLLAVALNNRLDNRR
jgi:hypothetical protein